MACGIIFESWWRVLVPKALANKRRLSTASSGLYPRMRRCDGPRDHAPSRVVAINQFAKRGGTLSKFEWVHRTAGSAVHGNLRYPTDEVVSMGDPQLIAAGTHIAVRWFEEGRTNSTPLQSISLRRALRARS